MNSDNANNDDFGTVVEEFKCRGPTCGGCKFKDSDRGCNRLLMLCPACSIELNDRISGQLIYD
jgi:MoaA/NifB/PqqE/SkfB family radical SAM enzyme